MLSFTAVGVAVATAATIGSVASLPSGPTAATSASSITLPSVAYARADGNLSVQLTYRCTNSAKVVHYIIIRAEQAADAAFVAGYRNDGGLVKADCTGRWVNRTYKLQPTLWRPPAAPVNGPAKLSVELHSKGSLDIGGWYTTTGPTVMAERNIRVRGAS